MFPPNLLLLNQRLMHQHGSRNFARLFRNMLQQDGIRHRMVLLPVQQQMRDVMPVQIAPGRFVLFRSGSFSEKRRLFSAVRQAGVAGEFERIFPEAEVEVSSLRLEGTQISMQDGLALVSDKVLWDNRNRKSMQIIDSLEQALERKVVIVPSLHSEDTGSLAGYLRMGPERTVLIQDSVDLDTAFRRRLESQFKRLQLSTVVLPNPQAQARRRHPAAYAGYLEFGETIYFPIFGNDDTDGTALEKMAQLYPESACTLLNPSPFGGYNGWLFLQTWAAEVDQLPSRAEHEAAGKPTHATGG